MPLKVILEEGADGYIIAECPQIPGCMSQGKTREEALANIKDAIQACLKVMYERLDRGQYCSSSDTA
jgi:predicted RNase H-like HicB family nuclease